MKRSLDSLLKRAYEKRWAESWQQSQIGFATSSVWGSGEPGEEKSSRVRKGFDF
jgi:hypothetical protein